VDGQHEAILSAPEWIKLKMTNVEGIETSGNYFYLNTGSPHYVTFVEKTEDLDVYNLGRNIRYNERFSKEGTNVNFIELINEESFNIRTYERGVEDETLSCGTGSVASAICAGLKLKTDTNSFSVHTQGGDLRVSFEKINDQLIREIWLEGPANFVFEGDIIL
ncbi:MAG TPA: diaminopimelate epimerase, partial [Bacteroidales bacterium]|nr:diaminopimelate epimerase [Bacteroidales bacterium]